MLCVLEYIKCGLFAGYLHSKLTSARHSRPTLLPGEDVGRGARRCTTRSKVHRHTTKLLVRPEYVSRHRDIPALRKLHRQCLSKAQDTVLVAAAV